MRSFCDEKLYHESTSKQLNLLTLNFRNFEKDGLNDSFQENANKAMDKFFWSVTISILISSGLNINSALRGTGPKYLLISSALQISN